MNDQKKIDLMRDKEKLRYLYDYHGASFILENLSEFILESLNKFKLPSHEKINATNNYLNDFKKFLKGD